MTNNLNNLIDNLIHTVKQQINNIYSLLSELSGFNAGREVKPRVRVFIFCVSLAVSVLIWSFVARDANSDANRTFSVPVKYSDTPKELIISKPIETVSVRLTGRMGLLSGVSADDISASINTEGLSPGNYNLPITVEAPPNIYIRNWQPTIAAVTVQKKTEKTMAIEWQWDSGLSENPETLRLPPKLSPTHAQISGPDVDVNSVKRLVAIVQSKKAKAGKPFYTRITPFNSEDKAVQNVSVVPSEVQISMAKDEFASSSTATIQASVIGQPKEDFEVASVKVTPDVVNVAAKESGVTPAKVIKLKPIDITGIAQDIHLLLPIDPELLDKNTIVTDTEKIRVDVTLRKKTESITYTLLPISIECKDGTGKKWRVSPRRATVSIEGDKSVMEAIDDKKPPFELYIDTTSIVADKISLPILAKNLPNNVKISKIEPVEVTATVIK